MENILTASDKCSIMSEKAKFVNARALAILADAKYPITTAQILGKIIETSTENPPPGPIAKKDVNSVMYALKGEKIQIHTEYKPPSWSLIGKFNFGE